MKNMKFSIVRNSNSVWSAVKNFFLILSGNLHNALMKEIHGRYETTSFVHYLLLGSAHLRTPDVARQHDIVRMYLFSLKKQRRRMNTFWISSIKLKECQRILFFFNSLPIWMHLSVVIFFTKHMRKCILYNIE